MSRKNLERDQRLSPLNSRDPGDSLGYDTSQVIVLAHSDHDDEIEVAGNRVDLADSREVGNSLRRLRHLMDIADRENDGGYHWLTSGS